MKKRGRGIVPEKATDLPRRLRIFFFLIMFIFIFGTIIFTLIENTSISRGFFRTLESLAFMFQSETVYGKLVEIFFALFGVFAVWWTLWSVFDMFIEGKISEYLNTRFRFIKIKKMSKHYVIFGGGRVGEEIARNLIKSKKDCVIIEKDSERIEKLRKKGYLVVGEDVSDSEIETLERSNIRKAAAAILVMPETEDNLMATLAIKEIAPDVDVYVRAENPSYVSKLKKAGAKEVVVPEITAAEKFVQNISVNENIAE
jgi:voltage-gated potassium channel